MMPIGKQKTATAIAEKEYDGDHLHCDDDDDYHDDGDDDGDDGEPADIMGWHNQHLLQDNCPRSHLHSRCSCSWKTSSS